MENKINNKILKRNNMNIYYLFFEKETFDLINNIFSQNIIDRFYEVAAIEDDNIDWIKNNIFNNYIIKQLSKLDKEKPLTINGEYIFTHFYIPISGWHLRGTPHLWQAIAREFSNDKIYNYDKVSFKAKFLRVFYQLTNVDLEMTNEISFHCEKYAHGGMSSGNISVEFFRNHLDYLINKMFNK